MHLTVKFSENKFYNSKSLWKLDFIFIQISIICEKHSPPISSPYQKVIKYICKTTLLKVDITKKEPITSAEELKL